MLWLLGSPRLTSSSAACARRVSLRKGGGALGRAPCRRLLGVPCDAGPLCWREALFWTLRKGCRDGTGPGVFVSLQAFIYLTLIFYMCI